MKKQCEHKEWIQTGKIPSAYYGCERTLFVCEKCNEKRLEMPSEEKIEEGEVN